MYKFQNHIDVLDAIRRVRDELPAFRNSHRGQADVIRMLSDLYMCLDVCELRQIVVDFRQMNRRTILRKSSVKKAA